jgi:hypothetical protein
VDAGNASSLYDYFLRRSGGIESHFHVRKDGVIEQYRSIYYQADANYLANDFAVSIETQGFGAGEWTPQQIASIKRLLEWLNRAAGIPLRKCPEWDSSGVGYHIQFGSPGKWTPVAKSCPGPDRVKQFNNVLVPWLNAMRDQIEEKRENGMATDIDKRVIESLTRIEAMLRASLPAGAEKAALDYAAQVNKNRKW